MTPDWRPTTVDRTLRFLMLQCRFVEPLYRSEGRYGNAILLEGYVNIQIGCKDWFCAGRIVTNSRET